MLIASYTVLRNSVESGTDTLFKLPKSESVPDFTLFVGSSEAILTADTLRQWGLTTPKPAAAASLSRLQVIAKQHFARTLDRNQDSEFARSSPEHGTAAGGCSALSLDDADGPYSRDRPADACFRYDVGNSVDVFVSLRRFLDERLAASRHDDDSARFEFANEVT